MRKSRRNSCNTANETKALLTLIAGIVCILLFIFMTVDICKYPESYMTISSNSLRMDLNEGDPEAIDYYYEHYIMHDRYLFDGPLTLSLVGERYGIEGEDLYSIYEGNGYTSVKRFIREYVEPLAQVKSLEEAVSK